MRSVRSRLALAAAGGLVAALTACAAPTPTGSPGPTVAPTPAPAPSSPTAPPTAREPAPEGLVDLSDVDPTILADIRYATDHNFVGRPIDGYQAPRCLLTPEAAEALAQVQSAARERGYGLKVYDCYRPVRAGQDFATWAGTGDETMKGEFYPRLAKGALMPNGYVGGGYTSHSEGSTVDLTLVPIPTPSQAAFTPGQALVPCTAPAGERFADSSIDMGTGFDCFDPRSHTLSTDVSPTARSNRLLLRELMSQAGFVNYAEEWWHYDLVPNPGAGTYYDAPIR